MYRDVLTTNVIWISICEIFDLQVFKEWNSTKKIAIA